MDPGIAATANVARVPLLIENAADFQIIDDFIPLLAPRAALSRFRISEHRHETSTAWSSHQGRRR